MIALPITAGMTRNGTNAPITSSGKSRPAVDTPTPYAANIGTAISTTIQLECTTVSSSFAAYSFSQSTGAATSRSRSRARKKLDSAVMMFDSSRIEKNPTRISPSSLPASSGPISGTPRKYTQQPVEQGVDERPEDACR